jgi:hypothetical protein
VGFAPDGPEARTTFEWELDGTFLVQRTRIPVPEAPDGLMIYAPSPDGEGYTQHYFDSRGVVRIYEMTFDGRVWTLERHKPDFSPINFEQRWTATLSDDGNTIEGTWDSKHPGRDWEKDFDLTYRRVPA